MPGERARPGERTLPVRRSKDLIVDKVKLNRVTLISADTGSGKSSQVPQMLLEEGMVPILCTQPRRLAVVAVAKRVAQERGCILGEEVGYHIGQLNISTTKSKIVFETAGILLEEIRVNGMAALARFKVVILDEVHERSVESDMVLTCVKQLMLRNPKIRLVLMSATADFKRYEEYFSELGREDRVERIYISNLATTVQSHLLQTKVKYLENVVEQLGSRPEHVSILQDLLTLPLPAVQWTDIGASTLNLIRDLVVQYHAKEPVITNSVLVFLPTYRSLEQQWLLLNAAGSAFRLFVLHSSIDIEHSVKAMEISCNKRRKVILATNVAESSVTIPGVSFVVDSCRSLEIFWDRVTKHHSPRLVWISQSQMLAEQRKGRTGRTCDGTVVRLVPRNVYHCFPKSETPQMQLFSLRKQVLMITSAESKAINDPILLLQKCINPPVPATVIDALDFLEKLQAIVVSPDKGRHAYHPTKYGQLLVSIPLSLESAIFVIRGGMSGYVRESVVIGAIMDTTPYPIVQPFGQQFQYRMNLEGFYRDAISTDSLSRPSVLQANLCAFEFWQRTFKDKHRLENLEHQIKYVKQKSEDQNKVEWGSVEDEELEQDWCIHHNLSLSALRAVAETADIIMEKMHQYRPEFICKTFDLPSYYTAENISHNCTQTSKICGPKISFPADDVDAAEDDTHTICGDWPFVHPGTYRSTADEKGIASLTMEVQGRQALISPLGQEEESNKPILNTPPQCSYYRQGLCTRGSSCPFSHSTLAKPMPCKFYLSFSGCRYGDECRFSHDATQGIQSVVENGPVQFEEVMPTIEAFLDMIPDYVESYDSRCEAKVLLLGEGNFTFAQGLAEKISPARIIATSLDREEDALSKMPALSLRIIELRRLNVQIGWGVDATNLVAHGNRRKVPQKSLFQLDVPWDSIGCIIWNFPFLGIDEDLENHKLLMRKFFASVAVTLFTKGQEDVLVILTLCNDQCGRWQVERAARESFFFLRNSTPFDTHAFGAYRPMRNNSESSFTVERSVTYVFQLCWPSDTLLVNRLREALLT